jgi:hypothetical protein
MVTGWLRQRSWETPEGDKRSVTEIEADEVGASLKWATAKVERTSQRGNGDRSTVASGRPSAVVTSTTGRRLIESGVGALGCSRRFPGCWQVAPPTPLPLVPGWLENGCAVLPAPDREWLHRGVPWPKVGLPSRLLLSAPRERRPVCR